MKYTPPLQKQKFHFQAIQSMMQSIAVQSIALRLQWITLRLQWIALGKFSKNPNFLLRNYDLSNPSSS